MSSITIPNFEELVKKNTAALDSSRTAAINASNATHKQQSDTLTSLYEGEISDSTTRYDELERTNAVQKLINEREVAENMANLGLTDSGLNRTQQTAVQLSAANNAAKIAREKQTMINSLRRELTSKLADVETSRASAEANINSKYEQQAWDAASSEYSSTLDAWQKNEEAKLKAETERIKAQQEAEAKKNFRYSLRREETESNGSVVNVFVGSDGEEIKVAKGRNPYTNDNNYKVYAAEYKDESIGFFSNGYQPKGLVSEGGKFNAYSVNGKVVEYEYKGKNQTIWVAPNKKYFLWDGATNQYKQISESSVKELAKKYS